MQGKSSLASHNGSRNKKTKVSISRGCRAQRRCNAGHCASAEKTPFLSHMNVRRRVQGEVMWLETARKLSVRGYD